jgi:hypothetical protein
MRHPHFLLILAASLCASHAANAHAPATLPTPRYLPEISEWRSDDPVPRPGLMLEMLTVLDIARENCTGSHRRMLARYTPRMLSWRRIYFQTERGNLRFQYRRAYGERWETVLTNQLAEIRNRYQAHPDRERFCRLAAIVARDGSGEHGENDLRKLFATMIRYIDPAASETPAT